MSCTRLKKVFLPLVSLTALLALAVCSYASPMSAPAKERRLYLSPVKTPGPLRVEPMTAAWKSPPQIVSESFCSLCSNCLPSYLINLPKQGKIYRYNCGIRIEWPSVVHANNNLEDGAVYVLFRYNSASAAEQEKDPVTIAQVYAANLQPAFYSWEDKEAHSDKVYYYRLLVTDRSRRTAASDVFFASYQDNRPPAAPTGLQLEETDKAVKISWQAGTESDLAGYLIYRRTCKAFPSSANIGETNSLEPFELVGTIGKTEKPVFMDYYPPKKPAHSYMYCVKAIDQSQNISVNTITNVICGHFKRKEGTAH